MDKNENSECVKMIIGDYSFSYLPNDNIWIENRDGEGMQCTEKQFSEWIKRFFEENF